MPTTRTALPATPRMATCTLSSTHQVVSRQRQFHPSNGLNDTDSSRVYPCLETKVSRLQANASNCSACDLAASVILSSFVAPPTCVSSISSSSRLQVNSRLTSAGFYPCTDSNCISCTGQHRTALRATSRRSPAQLLRQRACSDPPGAVPSGYVLKLD